MRILGISAHYHDSAAALVIDGVPVAAVEEERLSRRKNDASFPLAAISWCLESAGLQPGELDAVVFYEKPMLKFARILTTVLRAFPRSRRAFVHAMRNALGEKVWIKGTITAELGVSRDKVLFTQHHQAHAAAAFFPMPTERAAILTTDGVGEWATLTVGRGSRVPGGPSSLELLREVRFPHSLGLFYSAYTAYLGFPVNEGEYKVMGLASYGQPRFVDRCAARSSAPRTARSAGARVLRLSGERPALVRAAFHRPVRPAPGSVRGDRSGDCRRGALSRTSRPARRRCWRRCWSTSRAACTSRPASPISAWAVGWRSTGAPTPGCSPRADSSGCSSRPRRATPDARWARPSTPTGSISVSLTGPSPIIRSGVPSPTPMSWPASPPRTDSLIPRSPATRLSARRSRRRWPPGR